MSEPVNLNKVRKARAREEARAKADENAVRYGRSKAEKELDKARQDKARRDPDGHQSET